MVMVVVVVGRGPETTSRGSYAVAVQANCCHLLGWSAHLGAALLSLCSAAAAPAFWLAPWYGLAVVPHPNLKRRRCWSRCRSSWGSCRRACRRCCWRYCASRCGNHCQSCLRGRCCWGRHRQGSRQRWSRWESCRLVQAQRGPPPSCKQAAAPASTGTAEWATSRVGPGDPWGWGWGGVRAASHVPRCMQCWSAVLRRFTSCSCLPGAAVQT